MDPAVNDSTPNDKTSSPAPAQTAGALSGEHAPSGRVQLKESLRGMSYEEQVSTLTPVQARHGGEPVQMSGGIEWVAGIDIGKASTYDAGGGHSYKDHGAHTTKEQHKTRLSTGVAPSGRASRVPSSAPGSSKFDSDSLHQSALATAAAQLAAKNTGSGRKRGINGKVGVSGAGTIFTRDDREVAATDVHVDIQVVGDKFNINTAFPTT